MALKVEENQSTTTTTTKTKKRRKAAETLVHFVLDETGSMNSVRDATIEGFNEYVNGLKTDKKGKYWLSLTKFDSSGIVSVYEDTPINEVPDLTHDTYRPGAMTNLNDAIGVSMKKMETTVEKRTKKCNTLIVVMTDGHENASREWNADDVKKLIQSKEQDGWTVTFLGANMDAQKVGRTYAIREGNAKSYSVQNMGTTMRGMSAATSVYAASASLGVASDSFFAGTSDWTGNEDSTTVVDSSTPAIDSLDLGSAFDPNLFSSTVPEVKTSLSERVKPLDDDDDEEDTDNG